MADNEPVGPDLQAGIPGSDLADGAMLQGHVGGDPVLLVRQGGKLFAVDALMHALSWRAGGRVGGERHGALSPAPCLFRSCAPAKRCTRRRSIPIACWPVEQRDGRIVVGGEKTCPAPPSTQEAGKTPERIVIVGGGAAGFAAAERLRRERL